MKVFDYSQVPEDELEVLKRALESVISEYEGLSYNERLDVYRALLQKIEKDCKEAAEQKGE